MLAKSNRKTKNTIYGDYRKELEAETSNLEDEAPDGE